MNLLAPNGKPSNLTQEQWFLVRKPEFKAWFGDWEKLALTKINDSGIDEVSLKRLQDGVSKVVDENGEPLVVYHGSPYNFTIFKQNEIEVDINDKEYKSRFWFIVDKNWADNYSKKGPTATQKSYAVFLNIKNPKYDFNLYVEDSNDGSVELRDKKIWVAIATNSNQIKLADGMNTTFDGSNPDIRFKTGGEIENELRVVTKKEEIIEYLTRNSGNWKERDRNELEELFITGQYSEQKENIIKDLSEEYYNFYSKNPLFKKIPLIIYENNIKMGFGEGELFRYEFFHVLFISSSEKEYQKVKKTPVKSINDLCTFVYEKYENPIYGALMHEYGHYININKAIYITDDWLYELENYKKITNFISLYAGEKRIEFLAETFALKNAPNFHQIDENTKKFIIENYDKKIWDNNPKNFKTGGKVSKTAAPKKEQIYGSKINKQDSSANIKKAKSIKFDEKTILTISDKVKEHNKKYPNKKINLSSAKAVVRRGMGAYSSSHRPTITGGKPNSRVAWGLARLNAFIYKIINGKSKSGRYKQDDDLIKELGIMVKSYKDGGEIPKANKMFHLPIELTVYVPSTKDVDKVISKSEMNERVNEVKNYLGKTFGGFSASDVQGGFVASDGNIVNEDIIKVVSFAQKEDYEKNKEELVKKVTEWAEKWSQEAIGLEYEGDLYYVPEKLKKGGNLDNTNYKKKESYWEGWGFSDRIKALLKGSKKDITQAFKDLQIAFPDEDKEIIKETTIEIFVEEKDLKRVKKIANYNNLTLMYEDGGKIDYSEGWNQDYENDPLVKAKRKAKETAIRAGLAYATGGGSEIARAEGQAMQQAMASMQSQQQPAQGQPTTQSALPEGEINPQLAQQMIAQNPQLIQMLTKSGGGFQGMAKGGNVSKLKYSVYFKKRKSLGNYDREIIIEESNKTLKQIEKILYNAEHNSSGWYIKGSIFIKDDNGIAIRLSEYKSDINLQKLFEEKYNTKMATGGQIDYALGGIKTSDELNKAFESLGDSNTKLSERFKRGGVTPKQQNKIARVMREFKEGKLHSGSKQGPVVKNREQAIAIALSEAGASKKMASGGSLIENFVSEMVKNQIARRTLRIKDQDKFNKFMQDIKPFVDKKIVRVKRNPIDKEEVWISLQSLKS
jgi:hypothetical protein